VTALEEEIQARVLRGRRRKLDFFLHSLLESLSK
jgi:hypothetical protein